MIRNGLLYGLVLLSIAMAIGVAAYLRAGRHHFVRPEPVEHCEVAVNLPPPPAPVADAALAANVFHKLRGAKSPPAAEPERSAAAPLPQGNFTLHGIFSYGEQRGALISGGASAGSKGKAPKRIFRVGDPTGDNYHVTEISAREVILNRGAEKLTLQLYKKTEKKP